MIRRLIRIVAVLGVLGGLGFALAKLMQGRRTTQARLPSGEEPAAPKRSETPLVEPRMLRNVNLKSPDQAPSAPDPTQRVVGVGPQAPPASAPARATVASPAPTPETAPAPEPAPAAAPAAAAPAAAAAGPKHWVDPDGAICPTSHPVKAKLASGIFHLPGMTAYERTTPDRCYADEAAAEADGLRKAKR